MAQSTAHLAVSGMHCGSCSMLVDMTLKDLPGVIDSSTSHADGKTTVTFDDSVTDVPALIGAIRSVGYEAEPEA